MRPPRSVKTVVPDFKSASHKKRGWRPTEAEVEKRISREIAASACAYGLRDIEEQALTIRKGSPTIIRSPRLSAGRGVRLYLNRKGSHHQGRRRKMGMSEVSEMSLIPYGGRAGWPRGDGRSISTRGCCGTVSFFLGTAIDDDVANIVSRSASLLWKSDDP